MTAAVLAAALLCAAPAGAVRPLTPPAPPFPTDAAWVNSAPLPMSLLRGRRVVLVAFLNLDNLRSRRAARVLERWWDRYALHGLMIVGVHTPDYEFDRDALLVRRAVRAAGITFPVVTDTKRELWDAYENEGWPAFYLVDEKGRIVTDRLGEGHYERLEEDILAALADFNGYEPPEGRPSETDPKRELCGHATSSFYLGSRRGVKVGALSRVQNLPVGERRDGEIDSSGRWEEDSEALRYAGSGAGSSDQLYLIWRGGEVGAVLSPGESLQPVDFFVKLDNLWLHSGNAGPDVRWDDVDRSYVHVEAGGLYLLAHDPNPDRLHEMALTPDARGAAVHGFEFSDQCEARLK